MSITWTCHGCGQEREDEWISVAHFRVKLPLSGHVVEFGARHCNDRARCLIEVAVALESWAKAAFNAEATPAVHVLFGGFALCGTLCGVPAEWPAGHTWVRVDQVSQITCELCRLRSEEPLCR